MEPTASQSFALLALDPKSGKVDSRAHLGIRNALAGTLLVDLLTAGSVEVDDDDKVTATDTVPRLGPTAEAAWEAIRERDKKRSIKFWVTKPTKLAGGLPGAVYDELVSEAVLRDKGRRNALSQHRYQITAPGTRDACVDRLGAVLDGRAAAAPGDLVQLALLPACELTRAVFGKGGRRATEARIKSLVADDSPEADVAGQVARTVASYTAGIITAVVVGAAAGSN